MDKFKKIFLIILLSFLSFSNIAITNAEDDEFGDFVEMLNSVLSDPSLTSDIEGDASSEEVELNSAATNTYTNEAMYNAQNSNTITVTNNDTNLNSDLVSDEDLFSTTNTDEGTTTTQNVAVSKLPTTGPEHILLLLLSFAVAGFIFYKKRIIK